MIKFFRRLRQKLIYEDERSEVLQEQNQSEALTGRTAKRVGRLKRYLIYAIGEILLVVLGILIALQINNWNEERKNVFYIESLLVSIESELINNIQLANEALSGYTENDSFANLVVDDAVTRNDYLSIDRLRNHIYSRIPFNPTHENLKKLIEKEEFVPIKYNNLISYAKIISEDYAVRYIEVKTEENEILKENMDFITFSIPTALKQDSATMAAKINFYTTNEIYKSRVSRTWLARNFVRRIISSTRYQSIAMLIELKRIRSDFGVSQMRELFFSLEFEPFQELNCQETPRRKEKNLEEPYVLINLSNTPKKLRVTYLDGYQTDSPIVNLGLNEIKPCINQYRGMGEEYTRTIEVLNEGKCIKKYVSRKNGYLIIE